MVERSERNIPPRDYGIRLFAPGDRIKFTHRRKEFSSFQTPSKQIQDLGNIYLAASRGMGENNFIGVTVRENALVFDDANRMEKQNKNLYTMSVDIRPGVDLPGTHELVCRMRIDGIQAAYESDMVSNDLGTEDSYSGTLTWRSLDPTDTNEYDFMVSPKDTALLRRLSFTFHVRRVVLPDEL